jgi:hypothetical protein
MGVRFSVISALSVVFVNSSSLELGAVCIQDTGKGERALHRAGLFSELCSLDLVAASAQTGSKR